MYLVFEGPDGSGKSTMMEMLSKDLEHQEVNYKVVKLHQPGSTLLGEKLRALCKDKTLRACGDSQFYMMAADHSEFVDEHLKELCPQSDVLILQDRHSAVSGYAYQVVGNGASFNLYNILYGRDYFKKFAPDVVILFQPSLKTIGQRISKRGEAKDRYEASDFLKRVVKGYKEVANVGIYHPRKYLTINANCDKITMYKRMLKGLIEMDGLLDQEFIDTLSEVLRRY
jgi:dTMP kinase